MGRQNWMGALLLLGATAATAQQNTPHIAYAYPAGGRQGTTFEITVGGQFLEGAGQVYVTGEGVRAETTNFSKPLPQPQLDELREELRKLNESHRMNGNDAGRAPAKAPAAAQTRQQPPAAQAASSPQPATPAPPPAKPTPWTPEDKARAEELRARIAETMRLRTVPALSQTVSLRITVAPNATPGRHELRLLTNQGLTNPLAFWVDSLPEYARPFQYVSPEMGAGGGLPLSGQAHAPPPETPVAVTLPVILNGQMMPSSVHRYVFHATKGQHLVFAARTRALIPYMSDAVPGWFQARMTLFDPKGRELASADHFRFGQEPVIEQEIGQDGDYVLEIHDVLYRGREDFVYRIAAGELPFVTSVFPLGAKKHTRARVELAGWNLDTPRVAPSTGEAGVEPLGLGEGEWSANPPMFAVGTLPETTQTGPTAATKSLKPVKLPMVVNGRIAHPGEGNVFRIDAKAGEEFVAEVYARRLGSPLDTTLTLTDAKGKQIAAGEDFSDKGAALLTDQADARLTFRAATAGTYYLRLGDAQQNGGPEYGYRLRISHPQPDFELRVTPSSVNLRPGRTVPVTVYVLRHDGFSGDVNLRIKTGPWGLVLSGGTIPAGADSVRVTLTAPTEPHDAPQKFTLEGEAEINGSAVKHLAVPADDQMQAFAWHHLVPAQAGLVMLVGKERREAFWTEFPGPVQIPAGGTVAVHLHAPRGQMENALKFTLNDPPRGIAFLGASEVNGEVVLRLHADATVAPGLRGNLIVDATMIRPSDPTNPQPQGGRTVPLGTLPAIPFGIEKPQ